VYGNWYERTMLYYRTMIDKANDKREKLLFCEQ